MEDEFGPAARKAADFNFIALGVNEAQQNVRRKADFVRGAYWAKARLDHESSLKIKTLERIIVKLKGATRGKGGNGDHI